jgi:hypothetical protein
MMRFRLRLRRMIAKSWILSRCYYPLRDHRLSGRANDEIWYFSLAGWRPGGSRRRNRTSSRQRGASLPRIYPSRVTGHACFAPTRPQ